MESVAGDQDADALRARSEALAHDHVYLAASHDSNARRTLWVVGLTVVMMIVEIIAGTVFNSMALLADGFHMATHAGALGIAAAAYAFARRQARNPRFTFGTGKVGDLAGFASALMLAVVAIGIAVESGARLFEPQSVAFSEAILVAVVGLAVNLASAALLAAGGHAHHPGAGGAASHHHHHHHHHHEGHAHPHGPANHDNNLRAALVHVLTDALTSVLAIVALVAGRQFGWVWLDAAIGLVGSAVILAWAWRLLRDTGAVLLDTADPALASRVRSAVEAPGDARISDLHLWQVGPGAHAAIVSVCGIDAAAVRHRLSGFDTLAHLTVEVR